MVRHLAAVFALSAALTIVTGFVVLQGRDPGHLLTVDTLVGALVLLLAAHGVAYASRKRINGDTVAAIDYLTLLAAGGGILAILGVDASMLRRDAEALKVYASSLGTARLYMEKAGRLYCARDSTGRVPPDIGSKEEVCVWLRKGLQLVRNTEAGETAGWEAFVEETIVTLKIPSTDPVETDHLPDELGIAAEGVFGYFLSQANRADYEQQAAELEAWIEENDLLVNYWGNWILIATLVLGLTRVTIEWRNWRIV